MKQLRAVAVPATGAVFLPGGLIDWVNSNGGETVAYTNTPLRLDYTHWDRIPTWERVASYDRFVFLHVQIADGDEEEGSNHLDNFHKVGIIPSEARSAEHPNVQVIDIRDPERRTQLEACISGVFDDAIEAHEVHGAKTFINFVYKGPATTEEGKIVVACKNGPYALEKRLYTEDIAGAVMLWSIFDCPRTAS